MAFGTHHAELSQNVVAAGYVLALVGLHLLSYRLKMWRARPRAEAVQSAIAEVPMPEDLRPFFTKAQASVTS